MLFCCAEFHTEIVETLAVLFRASFQEEFLEIFVTLFLLFSGAYHVRSFFETLQYFHVEIMVSTGCT